MLNRLHRMPRCGITITIHSPSSPPASLCPTYTKLNYHFTPCFTRFQASAFGTSLSFFSQLASCALKKRLGILALVGRIHCYGYYPYPRGQGQQKQDLPIPASFFSCAFPSLQGLRASVSTSVVSREFPVGLIPTTSP